MDTIDALEKRLASALDRIGKGIEDLPLAALAPVVDTARNDVQMALDEERMLTAQLNERLRAVKEKDEQAHAQSSARIAQMTEQLDTQGAELKRMRNTTVQLREVLRILREASAKEVADPHLINRAMLAELEALRATRLTEVAEMDEILAELAPLIEEVREDA